MQPKRVWAVYFSGTGTTEKTVRRIASGLAAALSVPLETFDFTPPAARQADLTFGPDELVVWARPPTRAACPTSCCPTSPAKSAAAAHRRCRWCCSATGPLTIR